MNAVSALARQLKAIGGARQAGNFAGNPGGAWRKQHQQVGAATFFFTDDLPCAFNQRAHGWRYLKLLIKIPEQINNFPVRGGHGNIL